MESKNSMFGLITEKIILKHRYLVLLSILIFIGASVLGVKRLRLENSNESFFSEGDPIIKNNDKFKELFGNEEFVYVQIEASDVFDKKVLSFIRELSNELEQKVPFAKEALAITSVDYSEADSLDLKVNSLIPDNIPESKQELDVLKKKAFLKDVYQKNLITKDGKVTGIFLSFEKIPKFVYLDVPENFNALAQEKWPDEKIIKKSDIQYESSIKNTKVDDPRKLISPAVNTIIKKYKSQNIVNQITVIGVPLLDYQIDSITSKEMLKFGIIAILASSILLLFVFRSFLGLISPILVFSATLSCVFGLMGYAGIPITLVSTLIPMLIIVIATSYCIHVMNHFQQEIVKSDDVKKAISKAAAEFGYPVLLSALTTAVGFFSFVAVPIKPIRQTGLVCSYGVMLSLIFAITICPVLLSFTMPKLKKYRNRNVENNNQFFSNWTKFLDKKKGFLIVSSMVISIIFVLLSLSIQIKTDFLSILGEKFDIVQDVKRVTSKIGGFYSYEIVIDLPENDMSKEPEILKAADSLSRYLESFKETKLVMSFVDIIKDINQAMHENLPNTFKIPEKREEIAQYLLLYEMSGGDDINEYVDYDYKKIRISVQCDKIDTEVNKHLEYIRQFIKNNFPKNTQVQFAGDMLLMLRMADIVMKGQILSTLLTLLSISLFIAIAVKSLKFGFLAIIPNVIPVIVVVGIMAAFKIPINMITMMISPIIIGIAVDDTLHFIIHYQKYAKQGLSSYCGTDITFRSIGRAVIFTSVVLAIGFGIIGLSNVKAMQIFGIFSAIGIISALIADLILTPSLFLSVNNKKKMLHNENVKKQEAKAEHIESMIS